METLSRLHIICRLVVDVLAVVDDRHVGVALRESRIYNALRSNSYASRTVALGFTKDSCAVNNLVHRALFLAKNMLVKSGGPTVKDDKLGSGDLINQHELLRFRERPHNALSKTDTTIEFLAVSLITQRVFRGGKEHPCKSAHSFPTN